MKNEMKRYRVEFEIIKFKDKVCIELSAKDICEAVHKARAFMEKHIIIIVNYIFHML